MKISHLIFIVICLFITSNTLFSTTSYEVSGEIIGLTGKHKVYIGLFRKEKWLKKPFKGIVLTPEKVKNGRVKYILDAPKGEYAITVYEDVDGNGKLTRGMFGPKEPYGFYRNYSPSFGPPDFDDCHFRVENDLENLNIPLLNRE